MKNNELIKSLKNGIKDIDEGYTDEFHFLFNKQTIEIIIESLERSHNSDYSEIALTINKIIHDECENVPHDIGLRIMQKVKDYFA